MTLMTGAVVVAATIIIFAVSDLILLPSVVVGMGFLLYSEIVFFGGIVFVDYFTNKYSGVLTRISIGIPIEGYAIIVFLSSLIYMNFSIFFVRWFIILQVALFAIAFVIVMTMGTFSGSVLTENEKVFRSDLTVKRFINELELIKEKVEKKKELDLLIETLRYSDTSLTVDADVELDAEISRLAELLEITETGDEEFERAIKEIDFLIKKRNMQTKNFRQRQN